MTGFLEREHSADDGTIHAGFEEKAFKRSLQNQDSPFFLDHLNGKLICSKSIT